MLSRLNMVLHGICPIESRYFRNNQSVFHITNTQILISNQIIFSDFMTSIMYMHVPTYYILKWNQGTVLLIHVSIHTLICIIITPATELISYYHISINLSLNPAFFSNRLNNGILYLTT